MTQNKDQPQPIDEIEISRSKSIGEREREREGAEAPARPQRAPGGQRAPIPGGPRSSLSGCRLGFVCYMLRLLCSGNRRFDLLCDTRAGALTTAQAPLLALDWVSPSHDAPYCPLPTWLGVLGRLS